MSASPARPQPPRHTLTEIAEEWIGRRALRAVGPLRPERVELPGAAASLEVLRPGRPIDDPDSPLPYWSEIWPSGVVLAGTIAREPHRLRGRRVLELGPGVGVTAIAALRAGADLTVADSALGALALCALNAREQTGVAPRTLRVDWRDPSPALLDAAGPGFALVLAADVLYERVDIAPLTRLLDRVLAPNGEVWLAEPGRDPAERFVEQMRRRGWSVRSEQCASPRADPHEGTRDVVAVHRLRRGEAGVTRQESRVRVEGTRGRGVEKESRPGA